MVIVCFYVFVTVFTKVAFLTVSPVVGELFWLPVGRGFSGMPEGDADCQHPPEPPGVCPDCHQVPRAADNHLAHRALRILQELRR